MFPYGTGRLIAVDTDGDGDADVLIGDAGNKQLASAGAEAPASKRIRSTTNSVSVPEIGMVDSNATIITPALNLA